MTETQDMNVHTEQFEKIPLDLIDVTDLQTRSSLGDLTEMAASITSRGVQEPVLVKALETGRFELFVGNRRFEASKMAGKSEIPALVHNGGTSRQLMLELNMLENVQREDLNPIDEARGFEKLQKEFGMTDDQLCEKLGINKKRLRDRKRLLKMTDVVQEALLQDRIPLAAAYVIDRLPKDRQGKFVQIAEELRGARLVKMVDKELEKIKTKAEKEAKEKEPVDPDKAAVTALVKGIRQAGQIVCNGLGYDDDQKGAVKRVNFRPLDEDDLHVVAKLFDDCADRVPDNVDINDMAKKEIVEAVEGPLCLNVEWPIVRQGLIDMVMARAQELAIEQAADGRPKITFAIAKEAIEEFFEAPELPEE